MAVYTDYIGLEIKSALDKVAEEGPQFEHHYWKKPTFPIIKKGSVGNVNYSESNYACGPLTKTIYCEDEFGNRYKVSVEDLKQVKGHGWITKADADKLDTHYDRDLKMHVVSTPEYNAWLEEERAKHLAQRA